MGAIFEMPYQGAVKGFEVAPTSGAGNNCCFNATTRSRTSNTTRYCASRYTSEANETTFWFPQGQGRGALGDTERGRLEPLLAKLYDNSR